MNKIVELLKWKKLDKFFVLNYPYIWRFKLYYMFFFSLFFIFFMDKNIVFFINFIILIIASEFKFYTIRYLSGIKEYLLSLIFVLLLTLPLLITSEGKEALSDVYLLSKYQQTYNLKYKIDNFNIKDGIWFYKIDDNKTRSLNKEELIFINTFTKLSNNSIELIELFELIIISLFIVIFLTTVGMNKIKKIIMSIMLIISFFLIKIDKNLIYFEEVDKMLVITLFILATIFIYLYKKFLNEFTIFLNLLGLFIYFIIFYKFLDLSILHSGLLVILNILFIISSLKEKVMILNARPKK